MWQSFGINYDGPFQTGTSVPNTWEAGPSAPFQAAPPPTQPGYQTWEDMPGRPHGARPQQPFPSEQPRQFTNRFVAGLNRFKDAYATEDQQAVARLTKFDQHKHSAKKNREVIPSAEIFHRGEPGAGQALERTASFLLIEPVLNDITTGITENVSLLQNELHETAYAGLSRALLTGQVEAVRHQCAISSDAVIQKYWRNERIRPFLTYPSAFQNFLVTERPAIYATIYACQFSGENRRKQLMRSLETLTRNYLLAAGRLPFGVWGKHSVDMRGVTFREDNIGVWLLTEEPPTMGSAHFVKGDGYNAGLIFVDPGTCDNPASDPSIGNDDERFYSSGFEHLEPAAKQAAVYIQKLFYQLGDLEQKIAEYQGECSNNPIESFIASKSKNDRAYRGSVALGDRHDEHGIQSDDQRKAPIENLKELKRLSDYFKEITGDRLLPDEGLNRWIASEEFTFDMDGLRHPELRVWHLNTIFLRTALMNTGVLERPAFGF